MATQKDKEKDRGMKSSVQGSGRMRVREWGERDKK